MPFSHEEIEELFEEAQEPPGRALLSELREFDWMHTTDHAPGKAGTKLFRTGCGLCGTRGHDRRTCRLRHAYGAAFDKMRKAEKNKRYSAKNPRREYKTAWAIEKYIATADQRREAAIIERVNKLRGGYVPKQWGKLWKLARTIFEQEKASG